MKNRKLIVLGILMVAAFFDGITRQLTEPGAMFATSDYVFTLIGTLLVFLWYRFDSDERVYRRTSLLNVAMVAMAIFALPYYFFRSRGFRKGCLAIGVMLTCFIGYFLVQHAGEYAAYHLWQT